MDSIPHRIHAVLLLSRLAHGALVIYGYPGVIEAVTGWSCIVRDNDGVDDTSSVRGFIYTMTVIAAVTEMIWTTVGLFVHPLSPSMAVLVGLVLLAIDCDSENSLQKLNIKSNGAMGLLSTCNVDVAMSLNYLWTMAAFLLLGFGGILSGSRLRAKPKLATTTYELMKLISWGVFILCCTGRFVLDLAAFADPYEALYLHEPTSWTPVARAVAARATRHACAHTITLLIVLMDSGCDAVVALLALGASEFARATLTVLFYQQQVHVNCHADIRALEIIVFGRTSVAMLACCVFGLMFAAAASVAQSRTAKEGNDQHHHKTN